MQIRRSDYEVIQRINQNELLELKNHLEDEYKEVSSKLKLDMSRGKPSSAQLELSSDMLDILNSSSDLKSENGLDVRNYGCLDGIPEAKKLMADIVGYP